MEHILDLDATTLVGKLKSGEIRSLQATDAYIDHLKRVNSKLNCLVQERFEQARAEAMRCDELRDNGKAEGRLFGVPISIKECFDVEEMSTTGGLIERKNHRSPSDGEVTRRLKQEGAIILGKTNTPTLCFCQETENKLYGRTNNPWDLSRTVGGSSGGEAALIAVGGASVGIGSDIGGSIRFPAHFNGVIGFKSGQRQVSQEGHFPFVREPNQETMLGMGAIAKSVQDAQLINEIIAQNAPLDVEPTQFELIIPDPHPAYPMGAETTALLKRIREFFSQKDVSHDIQSHAEQSKDVQSNVENDAQHKQVIGTEYPSFFTNVSLMWQLLMSIDGAQHIAELSFGERRSTPKREYAKEVLTGKSELHRYLLWALIGADLFKPSHTQLQRLYTEIQEANDELEHYLKNRIMILPVYHRTALPHGKLYAELFSIKKTFKKYMPYIAFPNVFGLPALVIPVGTDLNGLPISVQLVSLVGNENALFHYGKRLEAQFRGFVRCTTYDA